MINTRWRYALRHALVAGLAIGAVATAGLVAGPSPLGGVWLTAALGPTAYVLLRPDPKRGRVRDGWIGHAVGIAAGLAGLALFGLWDAPSVVATHLESWPQVGAQAVAIAVTLLVLSGTGVDHAPAAATTLLVASGIAGPGQALTGLVAGVVLILGTAPLLARAVGRPG